MDLFSCECPTSLVKGCEDRALEVLVELHGLVIVAEVVGEQCQRELRRAAPAVTPLETGGTVVPQVESGIKRTAIYADFCRV